jgi:TfoX/Sxy family transcriptional regulator of competence genes
VAYDEALAHRVRALVGDDPRLSERKMFGGLCLMVDGNMFLGVVGDELMVRTGPDGHADALAQPHTREMDFTGTPMKTMVFVTPPGIEHDQDLERWVDRALDFANSLPPKHRKPTTNRR